MSGETDQLISWDQVSNQTGFNLLHVAVLHARDALPPSTPSVFSLCLRYSYAVFFKGKGLFEFLPGYLQTAV